MAITLNITNKPMNNLPSETLTDKKGLIIHFGLEYRQFDISAMHSVWDSVPGNGCHYTINSSNLYNLAPENTLLNHCIGGKNTYINSSLYNNDPNKHTIGLAICYDTNYEVCEKRVIQFCAEWLLTNNLTTDALWREFDLNTNSSPIQYLDNSKWGDKDIDGTFVGEVEKWYQALKDNKDPSANYTTIYKDSEYKQFIDLRLSDSSTYAKSFKPDDRNIATAKTNSADLSKSEITTIKTKVNNNMAYSTASDKQNGVDGDSCIQGPDVAGIKMSPDTLLVEPIYPDLITPPETSTSKDNSSGGSSTQDVNAGTAIPSVSDYEKRQKIFNAKDHADATKTVVGKPANNNDPFPVDPKIKQLESHDPKIKIDNTNFKMEDCNHPGCPLGVIVQRNFAMVNDMVIADSKRTEARITAIENNLSTLMRNFFRLGSRININCVYYGGQDVYGKYKSIRCLCDNRIDDGQVMTIDQCLCCSRYEPIIGQVYDILDDTGKNLAQVLDDNQMAYMNMKEYIELSRIEEVHSEAADAKLTSKPDNKQKQFKDNWTTGFKMDWTNNALENQNPNVNEYKYEPMTADKIAKYNKQGGIPDQFKDTRTDATSYPTLTYNADNYNIDGFGKYETNNSNIGGNASQVRQKIVDEAGKWVQMCQQGKAGYSEEKRGQVVNGIQYWDCSSMAQECYKAAGLTIGSTTYDQYPQCKDATGGKLIPIKSLDQALPGDLVFFSKSVGGDIQNVDVSSVYHVAIYIGNNKIRAASTDNKPLTQQICEEDLYNNAFCFARPAALVAADKSSSGGEVSGSIDGNNYVYKFSGAVVTCYNDVGSTSANKIGADASGRICAAHGLPAGTNIYIPTLKGVVNSTGIFIVDDTGGPFFDFDINTNKDIGKQQRDAYVISWGNGSVMETFQAAIAEQQKLGQWSMYEAAYDQWKDKFQTLNFTKFTK